MSLTSDFEQFDYDNPHVYRIILDLSRRAARRGKGRIGISLIYGRARWDMTIETDDPEFKLNDHYQPFYARKIMSENEELGGLFELRGSEADAWAKEKYGAKAWTSTRRGTTQEAA